VPLFFLIDTVPTSPAFCKTFQLEILVVKTSFPAKPIASGEINTLYYGTISKTRRGNPVARFRLKHYNDQ